MKYVFYLAVLTASLNTFSANSLWQNTGNNPPVSGERKIIPIKGAVVKLQDAAFRSFSSKIPKESSGKFIVMSLPMPDGSMKDFKVFERLSMEQELADKYPMIKTYQAISVDDPAVTAKLDYTVFGFHAMVFSREGIYFIDPYTNVNTGIYNCYYKKDYVRQNGVYSVCETKDKEETKSSDPTARVSSVTDPGSTDIVPDNKIRTFRLALACTVEYSAAVAGPSPTKPAVLSAIVTSINRVNGVWEKELSIHLNLVAKEDTLIFLTTDSYTNNNGGTMLGQNQTVCDARIKTANYDIGHVFSTGGGGIAQLGCVCTGGLKAQGVTGSPNPVGDAYDIDYVIHEMGHQFGANHTFNGGAGSCAGNRAGSVAYEPGSGTTIMAYAGICDNNDIAPHSDDYFHRASINEIFNYISGTSCATITTNTNPAPTVAAYIDTFYIPYKTPFEITASASSSAGHPLTYCWEEYDLGPEGNWNNTGIQTAPIFRSLLPTSSGTRVFPKRDSLITNGIKFRGEVLPEVARDMKFRCTVRDYFGGYGVYNAPNTNLLVKSIVTSSLFRVSSQPSLITLNANTTQTISWDVAGTTASPISCANVDILLSLDSARTFPYVLAGNTPNDGNESVLIPNVATANPSARIKVKGSDNIFFDLNNGWIKIVQGVSSLFTSSASDVCEGSSLTFTNTSTGSPDSVRWTINGGTPSTSSSASTVTPLFSTAGTYTVSLVAYKGGVASTAYTQSVNVRPNKSIQLSRTICSGDSTGIGSQFFKDAGIYTVHLQTSFGCDSAVHLDLSLNPKKTTTLNNTICQGDSIRVGTQYFKDAGSHIVHLQTSLGCDSAVTLNLDLNPAKTSSISNTICRGDSVSLGSQVFKNSGSFTVHFQSSLSCDSAVTLSLTVNELPATPVLDLSLDSLVVTGSTGSTYSWYLNEIFQASTSVPKYKPVQLGNWTVVVSENNCASLVSNTVLLTGLKVKKTDLLFSIIPNPSKGQFDLQISSLQSGEYNLTMYTVTGRELLKETLLLVPGLNTRHYAVDHLEKGMYLISVTGKDGAVTRDLIIQ